MAPILQMRTRRPQEAKSLAGSQLQSPHLPDEVFPSTRSQPGPASSWLP